MNITEEMLREYLVDAEKAHKLTEETYNTSHDWPDFYAAYIYTRIAIALALT